MNQTATPTQAVSIPSYDQLDLQARVTSMQLAIQVVQVTGGGSSDVVPLAKQFHMFITGAN
jgi:hypothetical protein